MARAGQWYPAALRNSNRAEFTRPATKPDAVKPEVRAGIPGWESSEVGAGSSTQQSRLAQHLDKPQLEADTEQTTASARAWAAFGIAGHTNAMTTTNVASAFTKLS